MKTTCYLMTAVALCVPAILLADNVALGTDYLAIQSADVTLAPFGTVDFKGLPFGPGNTSLVEQRLADAPIDGTSNQILQVTELSLKSKAPVLHNGSFFDIFISLDPAQLANDTGSIAFSGGLGGGTFTSSLNLFLLAHAVEVGNPSVTVNLLRSATLTNSGGSWQPLPPAGAVIVTGADDGGPTDQPANLHSGLDEHEVDFFPGTFGYDFHGSAGGTGSSTISPAAVPEPATAGLVLLALLPLAYSRLRRK